MTISLAVQDFKKKLIVQPNRRPKKTETKQIKAMKIMQLKLCFNSQFKKGLAVFNSGNVFFFFYKESC